MTARGTTMVAAWQQHRQMEYVNYGMYQESAQLKYLHPQYGIIFYRLKRFALVLETRIYLLQVGETVQYLCGIADNLLAIPYTTQ